MKDKLLERMQNLHDFLVDITQHGNIHVISFVIFHMLLERTGILIRLLTVSKGTSKNLKI